MKWSTSKLTVSIIVLAMALIPSAGTAGADPLDEAKETLTDTVCGEDATAALLCIPEGTESWVARYNGPGNGQDWGRDVGVAPDGSRVFVTGMSAGSGTGKDFATLAYETTTGLPLWIARYDGPFDHNDFAEALAVGPDGTRVFVTGYSKAGGPGFDFDFATVAYDTTTGTELWVDRYDGTGNEFDVAKDVAVSPDGSRLFVTGYSPGLDGEFDFATVAYDAVDGNRLWVARYSAPDGGAVPNGVDVSPDGSRVFVTGSATIAYDAATGAELWIVSGVAGYGLGVSPDGSRVFVTGSSSGLAVVAYDTADGSEIWVSRHSGSGTGAHRGLELDLSPDGSRVFVTGYTFGVSTLYDYATLGYDAADGRELWVAEYDGPAHGLDYARSLGVSPDGSRVFVTGRSPSATTGDGYATLAYDTADGRQAWLARYNGPGNIWDAASSLAVSPDGSRVFVTGLSSGVGSSEDYATIAYTAETEPSLVLPL